MSFIYIPAPSQAPGTPPAQVIPSSEWLNEHDGDRLIAVSAAFIGLCGIFVALRFWSRQLQQSKIGWDDYLIYPALITCWISEATCIAIVPVGGVGTRTAYWKLSGQEYVIAEWAKVLYAVEMCYLLAACVTKLALLAIFLRVLRNQISRKVTQVMIGITIAAWIGESVACSIQCIPFAYLYDKTIPGGHCFDIVAFYEYLSIPNIITDVVLIILPIPTVWKLQTTRSQKIQLTFAFMLGGFGIIASILRFANFFTTDPLADPTYNSVVLLTWTVIEPGIYLISACLPSLRPLLNQTVESVSPKPMSNTERQRYMATYASGPSMPPTRLARNFDQDSSDHGDTSDSWSDEEKADGMMPESPFQAVYPSDGHILRTNKIHVSTTNI